MDSVVFIILRRMRAPLLLLIGIYAVTVLGLTLVPGVDAQGQPTPPLSFFHAFYFVSYTATTIGFGEIPQAFSDAQRLWVTVCIYLAVVGWSYSIITLLALVQDRGFQQAFTHIAFTRRVRRMGESFYIVCGAGETGGIVHLALDRMGVRSVALDTSEPRIQEIDLLELHADVPALAADASQPEILLAAGLRHPKCRGVLALTDNEDVNLAVAIAVRLLRPDIPVLARVQTQAVADNMASFGTDFIVSAYESFAEQLALALHAPVIHRMAQWLTGIADAPMPAARRPPAGTWIVCGYGRFGHAVVEALDEKQLPVTLIAPQPDAAPGRRLIVGTGTEAAPLIEAGVREAVGIVCGTNNDVNNLSIAMTARDLNRDLYVVMRQNHSGNSALFKAFHADMTLVPSRLVAQRCLTILTTPLLSEFLERAKKQDDAWAAPVVAALESCNGGRVPVVWSVRLNISQAEALYRELMAGADIRLDILLRDSSFASDQLALVPLMMERGSQFHLLPQGAMKLHAGDEILFAGNQRSRKLQELTLRNANTLNYLLTGRDSPGGWIWRRFGGKRS